MMETVRKGRPFCVPRISGCVTVEAGMPVLAGSVIDGDAEVVIDGQETNDYEFGSGDFYADWN